MLRYLREHSDLGLWSVSRVEGEDWILLKVDDEAYDVGDNTVLKWRDSFCSRLVQGEGPMFDHDCKESGAYADAMPSGAYWKLSSCRPRAPQSRDLQASISLPASAAFAGSA